MKELENLLKDLNKTLDKLIGGTNITNALEEALNEECTISLVKEKGRDPRVHISGRGLSLLIGLAGLEKSILEKTNCPSDVYEQIKNSVGIKGAE